jgi:hypothetical protein
MYRIDPMLPCLIAIISTTAQSTEIKHVAKCGRRFWVESSLSMGINMQMKIEKNILVTFF